MSRRQRSCRERDDDHHPGLLTDRGCGPGCRRAPSVVDCRTEFASVNRFERFELPVADLALHVTDGVL
jgi:hypothetical protein